MKSSNCIFGLSEFPGAGDSVPQRCLPSFGLSKTLPQVRNGQIFAHKAVAHATSVRRVGHDNVVAHEALVPVVDGIDRDEVARRLAMAQAATLILHHRKPNATECIVQIFG